MFIRYFLVPLIITLNFYPQVSVSADSVAFPQTFTGSVDSFLVYVKNNDSQSSNIIISNFKNIYILSDTLLSIPTNDSTILWIKYLPNQNVIDKDLIFITGDDSTIGSVISVTGSGKFGDSYDASTFNLYDAQLKSALTQLVSGHTSLGYNLARDKMYMEIDNQRVNGQGATQNTLECVYTGRQAVGYTSRTDAQNNYNFNTEHTWPQSTFNEAEPMKSDLYHLFPTDNPANSVRANYHFGKAVSNITWQIGGSKLGNNSIGQLIFEPRDVHKGDVARSMFYFITRYPSNYGNFFTQTQENIFREWNKLDIVGNIESARNISIALLQLKRNPYVDHPDFIDRIYSFATGSIRPVIASIDVLPRKVNFDSTLIGNSTSRQIYLANSGSGQLVVDSITISDSRFAISNNNFLIDPYTSKKFFLQFNPDSIKNYNAVITMYSNAGTSEIVLTGICKDNTVDVEDEYLAPVVYLLEQNYPNPFNPGTIISWQSPISSWQTLKVYDILGNEVATLVNEFREAGKYEVEFPSLMNQRSASLPSGVYFYQVQAGSFVDTKKMIYLK